MNNGVELIDIKGEKPNYADALRGRWGGVAEKNYFLTITKGVGHIETPLSDKEIELNIALPECYDFNCRVFSKLSERNVRVTNNRLKVKIAVGEQVNTNFKLKER